MQAGPFPAFAGWRIYLPTRRAARALASAMLHLEGDAAGARLLPRILPLGDVDEDELLLSAASNAWAVHVAQRQPADTGASGNAEAGAAPLPLPPPAIAPLPRLFLLADLLRRWAMRQDTGHWRLARHLRAHPGAVWRLARSLARLIDSFENEEVPLDAVARMWLQEPIAPERAEHLQAAQQFLVFLADAWPQALQRRGLMGAAARRAALIRLEAAWLRANPPSAPVIAAGSTGSLPATAELLSTIARLPRGCVVLPGLDVGMDEASWRALAPGHPQYGMRELLRRMEVDRSEVIELPPLEQAAAGGSILHAGGFAGSEPVEASPRVILLREAMRPVETTDEWRQAVRRNRDALRDGAEGLHLLPAPTRRQEALAIALLMRETLRHPRKTCMLITPDRTLARAVRAELARWNIEVDDSAGQPLIDTPGGMFLKLLMQAALEGFSAETLVPLLAHPLACFGMQRHDCAAAAADLELAVLRPLQRRLALDDLPRLARQRQEEVSQGQGAFEHPNVRHMSAGRWQAVQSLAEALQQRLAPLADMFVAGARRSWPVAMLLERLLRVAEDITTPPGESCRLWHGDAGEALAAALAEVFAQSVEATVSAGHAPRQDDVKQNAGAQGTGEPGTAARQATQPVMRAEDLAIFLQTELAARPLRPRHARHARLSILGLLEARLLRADRVILGGLNEGIWPEVAQNDPWLNRADRERLALPLPERRMGLSAHDFVQAAAAGEVWLTCAERVDQQPAEPSRWLVRLQAVLRAAGHDQFLLRQRWPLELAAMLDDPRTDPALMTETARLKPPPPSPAPPLHLRPARISASRVRTLLRDPYAIFARQVLRLEPLPALGTAPTPALFGTLVHAALEEFARRWPRQLPEDPQGELLALLQQMHRAFIGDDAHLAQFAGRFAHMAKSWISRCEVPWRQDAAWQQAHAECAGSVSFEVAGKPFRLTARADRIDVLADGSLRIIDYKTGTLPKRHPASAAHDPQLDLEAAMAMRGAFEAVGDARHVRELVLVRLSGAEDDPLEVDEWHKASSRQRDRRDVATRAEDAWQGLQRLLAAYMDPRQPYLPLDHGNRDQRPGDYDHFNRWREWLPLLAV